MASSSSWKKWSMGGALTALLCICIGYAALNCNSSSSSVGWSSNNIAPDAVDSLSHHHQHHTNDNQDFAASQSKKEKGEKKHVLTKAEMNTKLSDDQRKLLFY